MQMNNRVLAGIIAAVVLIAAAVGLFLSGGLDGLLMKGDKPSETEVTVLITTRAIPAGTMADTLASAVQSQKMPKNTVSGVPVAGLEMVSGRATVRQIQAGQPLTMQDFAAPGANPQPSSSPNGTGGVTPPKGTVELFMSFSGVSAANGTVTAGNRLSIFVTRPDGDGKQATQRAFSHILVTKVSRPVVVTAPTPSASPTAEPANPDGTGGADASTPDATPSAAPSGAPTNGTVVPPTDQQAGRSSGGTQVLTLALTPDDAARLISAYQSSKLWLAIENEDSPGGYGRAFTPDEVFQ